MSEKVNLKDKDPLQKRLEITNWVILLILASGGFLLHSSQFSLSILCGGLISIVNFHLLYHNLLSVFTKRMNSPGKAILIRFYLRLAVTALLLFLVISGGLVDVIGLIIGLSVVFLNVTLLSILTLSKKNCLEEVG
jgi:hypothetical protein